MPSLIDVRRFLHCNYNCHDVDLLERFYVDLFGLRVVMRSESSGSNATPFGIFGHPTESKVTFVYDHRGGRRSSSLELVQWIQPATIGTTYPDPWNRGIHGVAYTASDLDAIAVGAQAAGATLVRRSDDWLLLRDPEGVTVEVLRADGPSEARYLRIVCSDLERTTAWWKQIGFVEGELATVDAKDIWPGDDERHITAERSLVPTDDSSFGIVLTTWSGPLPIGPTYGMPYHQGLYRMAMSVDNVDAAVAALDRAGVARQNSYTFDLPGTKLVDGLKMVFIRDPDAILIELVERPREPQ
jgi:catechol 2,3-dioxygenase-like lactoylglutathione lyase family enzyme